MADGLLQLNPASLPGGKIEDVETLTGAGGADVIRQRLQVTGAILSEIARVLNTLPLLTDMGLVVRVAGNRAESAATSSVAGSAVAVTILAANPTGRIGASVYNDSTSPLYIKAGAGASTSDFTVKLIPDAYWEAPAGYSGLVTGVWASATGDARVTEYT